MQGKDLASRSTCRRLADRRPVINLSYPEAHQVHHEAYVVLLQKSFRIIVRVDVDLGERVEDCWFLLAIGHLVFEEGQDELESISLFNFINQLVDRHRASHRHEQLLDSRLIAVDVEQSTNDLRRSSRVDFLHVYLDEVLQTILV